MKHTFEETSRTVETQHGRIHYNELGHGKPVVLLHGSGPGSTGWNNFAPILPQLAQSYRCLAIDMPGWGLSEPTTWDQRNHVAAALSVMDVLGIDQAALIGNSMGGRTAIQFAHEYPDRVSHLITIGAGIGPRTLTPDGVSEGIKVLRQAYKDPSIESFRSLVEIMTYIRPAEIESLAEERLTAAKSRPEHLGNFLDGLSNSRDLPITLSKPCSVPTLVIHGRDDRVTHFEQSINLMAAMPNSRLVLFNRCGHWVQTEYPSDVYRLVRHHIENH